MSKSIKGPTCINSSGLQQYHLRRKHHVAKPDVEKILDFHFINSTVGWNDNQVGFNVDSSDCCRVSRQNGERHRLFDQSEEHVYVNSVKIEGPHELKEGETVQFGSKTSYQYIFERCTCGHVAEHGVDQDAPKKRKSTTVEVVPSPTKCFKIDVDGPSRDYTAIERITESLKKEICRLKEAFEAIPSLHGKPVIQGWSNELDELEKRLQFPKTTIAVIGPTGAGKSSLMNAILDHRILPTSGMGRACTAVVVEVVQNDSGDNFEAKVEFLEEKEWFDELQILIEELTKHDGKIRKQPPIKTSPAYASYCKVKAVYGTIDTLENLRKIDNVTNHLGTEENVSSDDPEVVRLKIGKYIETQDQDEVESGCQLWPIVKRVVLKIPKCAVCSNGVALVDLPGAGDSDAARNRIASQYIKECTAVLVVSPIHRAIDEKTTNELLEDSCSSKCQLYTDGLLENITFICNKTDDIEPSEFRGKVDINDEKQETQEIKIEKAVLQQKKSKELLTEAEEKKLYQLEKKLEKVDRDIKSKCARKRNEIVKKKIRQGFQAMLKALKRPSSMDEDEEEDDNSDDDDDDADETKNLARELKVFCCSSKEYQLGTTDDGPPQVFTNIADTEIPELRKHVQEMTRIQQQQRVEKFRQKLECFVNSVCHFIDDGEDHEDNQRAKSLIDDRIPAFESDITVSMEEFKKELDGVFKDLNTHTNSAAEEAKEKAEGICSRWGGPVALGGYPCKTYQATVRRFGEFKSPTHKWIDFNEQLSEPMMTRLSNHWVKVFHDDGSLSDILSNTINQMVKKLAQITSELRKLLAICDVEIVHAKIVLDQVVDLSWKKLEETKDDLMDTTRSTQREISRMVKPKIKAAMTEAYVKCAEKKRKKPFISKQEGTGVFKYIRDTMLAAVNVERETMFRNAAAVINEEGLTNLKEKITSVMERTCKQLVQNLKVSCQPLWDATTNRQEIRDALMPCIKDVQENLQKIGSDTGLGTVDASTSSSSRNMISVGSNPLCPSTSGLQDHRGEQGGDEDPPAPPQPIEQVDERQRAVCQRDSHCKTCKIRTGKEQICTLKDVVYGIDCKICRKTVYVGETGRELRDRIKEHQRGIKLKKDTALSHHFNGNNHAINDMTVKILEKAESYSKSLLMSRQTYWIKRLNTLPLGLNKNQ